MLETALPYFAAVATVSILVVLARRNRRQGWRRNRAMAEMLARRAAGCASEPSVDPPFLSPVPEPGLQLLALSRALEEPANRPPMAPAPAATADRGGVTAE